MCNGSVKYTRVPPPPARKMPLFFFHYNSNYFFLCCIFNLFSFFYIRIPTKNQAFEIRIPTKIQAFLCDVKLITPLLIFQFIARIWGENSISIPIHSGITYFWIWLFGEPNIQEGTSQRQGTDKQPLSSKPPLIRCRETYSAWQ